MPQEFIRIKQLASVKDRPGKVPVSPATIWRWVKCDQFPAPFRLSNGVTVWDMRAVDAWLAAHRAATV